MEDRDYSKREIDQLINSVNSKVDGISEDLRQHRHELRNSMTSFEAETGSSLMRIENQTIKTNGSVAEANKEIAKLKLWRAYLTGGLTLLAFMLTSLIAIGAIIAQSGGKI